MSVEVVVALVVAAGGVTGLTSLLTARYAARRALSDIAKTEAETAKTSAEAEAIVVDTEATALGMYRELSVELKANLEHLKERLTEATGDAKKIGERVAVVEAEKDKCHEQLDEVMAQMSALEVRVGQRRDAD